MGWTEVSGGEYVKWETPGQVVEGIWRGTSPGKPAPDGKPTMLGTIETPAGRVRFSATTVLKDRLELIHEGYAVRLTYTGTQKSKGGMSFKAFKVEVEDEAAVIKRALEDGAGIPGEEAPF